MNPDRSAALDLLRCARTVLSTRALIVDSLEPYCENVHAALSNILELASALFENLMSEDDPHEDFGDEPFTAEDAVQRAPAFIDRCCKILTGAGPFPYASMSVRTLTFAMQFKD